MNRLSCWARTQLGESWLDTDLPQLQLDAFSQKLCFCKHTQAPAMALQQFFNIAKRVLRRQISAEELFVTYRTTLADNVNTSIGCRFVLNGVWDTDPETTRAGHQPPCYAGQRVQPHCWCDLLITVVDTEFDRTKRVLLVGYSWIGFCRGLSPECVS